jgi:sigma-B regulation protein RsbU (phosphoserine phosphatase)
MNSEPSQPVAPPADHLDLISQMSRSFATNLDLDSSLAEGLGLIVEAMGAEAASLFLVEGKELVCHACAGPVDVTGLRIPAGRGIVGRTVSERTIRAVRDVSQDPDFNNVVDSKTGFVTRSILCAPLRVHGGALGAIELINKRSGDGLFASSDAKALQVMADAAALAVQNARMAQALVEQERMKRELELAGLIQRGLLPEPRPAPFPVAGLNRPARGVSGDFYDFLERPGGDIWFCLGDVSGKGMNAALLMAKTASLFRCLGKTMGGPGELLARLNDELCETSSQGMFVTIVAGVFAPATGRLCLSNAGHEPPLIWNGRDFEPLPAGAPPVGILPGAEFPEINLTLDGGCLYVFTDGLTEGEGERGEMLGAEGVMNLIAKGQALPLAERLEAVAEAIDKPGVPLRDDLTLLAIEEGRGR